MRWIKGPSATRAQDKRLTPDWVSSQRRQLLSLKRIAECECVSEIHNSSGKAVEEAKAASGAPNQRRAWRRPMGLGLGLFGKLNLGIAPTQWLTNNKKPMKSMGYK
jgi:hypothetical protein